MGVRVALIALALVACSSSPPGDYLRPCAQDASYADGGVVTSSCSAPLTCRTSVAGSWCTIECRTDADCESIRSGATCRAWGCWLPCASDSDCIYGNVCRASSGHCGF